MLFILIILIGYRYREVLHSSRYNPHLRIRWPPESQHHTPRRPLPQTLTSPTPTFVAISTGAASISAYIPMSCLASKTAVNFSVKVLDDEHAKDWSHFLFLLGGSLPTWYVHPTLFSTSTWIPMYTYTYTQGNAGANSHDVVQATDTSILSRINGAARESYLASSGISRPPERALGISILRRFLGKCPSGLGRTFGFEMTLVWNSNSICYHILFAWFGSNNNLLYFCYERTFFHFLLIYSHKET